MRSFTRACMLLLLLTSAFESGSALAAGPHGHGNAHGGHAHGGHGHGGNAHFGVFIGPGYWPGYYYPRYYYPPYYYPPVVVAPAQPPVYIEQGSFSAAPAPTAQGNWWYYCAGANAYYPYVRECPAGWQRVAPVPPS